MDIRKLLDKINTTTTVYQQRMNHLSIGCTFIFIFRPVTLNEIRPLFFLFLSLIPQVVLGNESKD